MSQYLKKMYDRCRYYLQEESGQGLVEYALILVLIAIVVIAAIKGIGSQANCTFMRISSSITPPQ